MCGIVGAVQRGRPVERAVLVQMTAALTHRGPDSQRVQQVSAGSLQVGLGQTRLRVIDLSDAAAQPMASDDGLVWVVFNGEIYNFQDLRGALQRRGIQFRSTSDTEVILRLYEAEGSRCVNQLDGMFAFAIWDGRQRKLLLARDRVGKKPLFYCATPMVFAFASEIKALLRHPAVVPEVDRAALPAFFLYGYVPTPRTFYQGIQKLPPGHLLELRADGEVRIEPYWDLLSCQPPQRVPRMEEAVVRVRELMTEAVRRRLIADVPLGAFLSGGIDSSVVVGLMSRLMREPVRTFSIGFSGDPRYDETAYARLVSKRFGTLHTEFVIEPSSVDLVERLVWHHDGPFADASAIPTYILSRLTRQHVTVALSGDGGDELFAGYNRFYGTLAAERIPVPVRLAAQRLFSRLPEWGGRGSAFRRLKTFAGSAALPFIERFSRWVSVFYEDLVQLLPESQDQGQTPQPLVLLSHYMARCNGASPLTKLLYVNLQTYLLDDLLVKMDRCSMAHGLETRSPFLDRALMEYVFRLPDAAKLQRSHTKVVLRQAFADLLPREILRRGKMGFSAPLHTWFRHDLRDYLHDLLLSPDARLRGYLNQDYVRRLYQTHLAGRADHSLRLWTLLTFEVWLRQLPAWGLNGSGMAQMVSQGSTEERI